MIYKRILAIILCAALMAGTLSGCGNVKTEPEAVDEQEQVVPSEVVSAEPQLSARSENYGSVSVRGNTIDGIRYVMIYNPNIYDENVLPARNSLSTGDIGSQIMTGGIRAGDMDITVPSAGLSQMELSGELQGMVGESGGVKAGGAEPVYLKGDTHEFFCYNLSMTARYRENFTCLYAGESCYIWSFESSISAADAKSMGAYFDRNIYPVDTAAFGNARFTENGGKINILFYPMTGTLGGFFCNYDIFASDEVTPEQIEYYGLNTGHAIININSDYVVKDPDFALSTLSHEFQHLICATDAFYYAETPMMRTWLNESMSAYAEELVFPGVKDENCYNQLFYLSDNFRSGQSLYNFEYDNDEFIGAYGAVYLFAKYMSELAGDSVFSNVHEIWRNSYDADITEARALMEAVPDAVRTQVADSFAYDTETAMQFADVSEEWLSKLTLGFYLETLNMRLANLENVEQQARQVLLYSSSAPTVIEGGGRIVVATRGGTFSIPQDAGKGLLYIGLNEDFVPVTPPLAAEEFGMEFDTSGDNPGQGPVKGGN